MTEKQVINMASRFKKMELYSIEEKLNDCNNSKEEALLFYGSSLVDKVNGITLEKSYPGIVRWFPCYGGGVAVYASLEALNNANIEELEELDSELASMENIHPLLNDDLYENLQFEMVNAIIDENYSERSEAEKTAIGDYLYSCYFYSDFIDYSESELEEYVKENN